VSNDRPATVGRVLRGVLEDGDARPVGGARIRVEADGPDGRPGDEAISGADGRFSVHVPGGADAAVLLVAERGHELRLLVAADATDPVRVVATPPDAVPVRALTPGTAPVPTRFGWQALRRSPGGLVAGATGDATAPRFSVRGLAPGSYALVVWAGPFLPTVHEPVTLDGVTSHPLVTVELTRRGASVAGRVLTPTHAPRPGVIVTLRPEDRRLALPASRTTSVADAGGRWRVEGLPAGRYAILSDAGSGTLSESVVNLVEREERSMDLVF
jgi:hypothetical protein